MPRGNKLCGGADSRGGVAMELERERKGGNCNKAQHRGGQLTVVPVVQGFYIMNDKEMIL